MYGLHRDGQKSSGNAFLMKKVGGIPKDEPPGKNRPMFAEAFLRTFDVGLYVFVSQKRFQRFKRENVIRTLVFPKAFLRSPDVDLYV